MKVRRIKDGGHIIHGGIGVFWHRKQTTEADMPLTPEDRRITDAYIYLPWLRLRIDLAARRRKSNAHDS